MMRIPRKGRWEAGSTLLLVLAFAAMGLLVLASILNWSSNEASWAQRRAENQDATAAAEAATQMALGRMIKDFQNGGAASLDNNMAAYSFSTPDPLIGKYTFNAPGAGIGAVSVQKLADWSYAPLGSGLPGLRGQAASYRVGSTAKVLRPGASVAATVWQETQFASIPLFAFGIYYVPDLEIAPSFSWRITGRVHANANLYCQPNQATVTFGDQVSAVRGLLQTKSPADPVARSGGTILYNGAHLAGVKSIILPVGTNNSPALLHRLIEAPPAGEALSSAWGQQRYYNKADLVILVSATNAVASSGAYNNFATVIPWSQMTNGYGGGGSLPTNGFINQTVSFFSKREGYYVQAVEVDLQGFLASTNYLTGVLGRPPKTVYIADTRTGANQETGVRLINGQTLPAWGLTVATLNPLYVKGHFNAPAATQGTTNTAGTAPASLVADAITLLSGAWNDANSTATLRYRIPVNTTLNAALVMGIVPSGGGYYSGGAENAIRLLENWTGFTLTWNGSLATLFYSQTAVGPWGTYDVYNPPTRQLNFDGNFLDQTKLPPSTPWLRTAFRTSWTNVITRGGSGGGT